MPKPSKYSKELQTEFCNLLKKGHGRTYACKKIGIDYVTFMNWFGINSYHLEYKNEKFVKAVKLAEKEKYQNIEDDMLFQIIQSSKSSARYWNASAWVLERMFSERYALKTKSELSGYIERGESEFEQKKRKQEVVGFLNKILEDSKKNVKVSDKSTGVSDKNSVISNKSTEVSDSILTDKTTEVYDKSIDVSKPILSETGQNDKIVKE